MPNKKKSSSPTIWYNSLAKFKSKLHSGILKEIKLCVCPSAFWKLTSGILFYSFFLFSPSHLQGNDDGNHDPHAHICARGGEFCQVSIFAKFVCQTVTCYFSCFAKIRWMSSWFDKLLELLAASTFERTNNFLRIFLHMERSDMPLSDHLQEFVNFYLPNLVFCQLLKRYAK
jgi:hypothetical protein